MARPRHTMIRTLAVLALGYVLGIGSLMAYHRLLLPRPVPPPPVMIEPASAAALAKLFPGWTITSYNHPRLVADERGMVIRGEGTPAGLTFRRDLDPSQHYRLTVAGRPVDGAPATMRLRIGNQVPQYLTAPSGSEDRAIGGTGEIEVVIYQDAAFGYRLDTLKIGPSAAH